jgi:hypothetical protein
MGSKLGLAAVFSGSISSTAVGQIHTQKTLWDAGLAPGEARGDTLAGITRDMFADNLGSKFAFSLDGVKLTDMTLIEVNDLNPGILEGKRTAGRECFSIIFRGPRRLSLRQDTYTVEHDSLGEFRILVVPGNADKGGSGLRYGALVNRAFPEMPG